MKERRPKPIVSEKPCRPRNTDEEAKRLILEIVAASGGRLVGRTKLYKAFYAAHMFYAKNEQADLTGHPIVHMPRGPGIDKGEQLLDELVRAGSLDHHPWKWWKLTHIYELLDKSVTVDESSPRGKAIKAGVRWALSRSAKRLSDETHKHSAEWRTSESGKELDVFEDLMKPEHRDRRERAISQVERTLLKALG